MLLQLIPQFRDNAVSWSGSHNPGLIPPSLCSNRLSTLAKAVTADDVSQRHETEEDAVYAVMMFASAGQHEENALTALDESCVVYKPSGVVLSCSSCYFQEAEEEEAPTAKAFMTKVYGKVPPQ